MGAHLMHQPSGICWLQICRFRMILIFTSTVSKTRGLNRFRDTSRPPFSRLEKLQLSIYGA